MKQTIITILLAFIAVSGQAQIHYPYPQIFNARMPVLQLYGIDGIPHIFLFAPDGTILARGLRGKDIDKKLEEIFNK